MFKTNHKIKIKPPGPEARKWIERNRISRAQPMELPVLNAEGIYVTDVDGNVYIDFGTQNVNTGHANPSVVSAVKQQIAIGGFNEGSQPKVILAEKLREVAPRQLANGKVGFSRGGTDAAERIILMVRAYTRRRAILVSQGGYHGDLPATTALTTSSSERRMRAYSMMLDVAYAPNPYCYRCPHGQEYPDCELLCVDSIKYLLDTISHPKDTAAFFIEPIQQHGGVTVPPPEYFREVRKICDAHGILLVDDEVATGFGRTGKMFALEHWGVEPDIMFMGKPIANGLDLGAVIGRPEIMECYWGLKGNPISCAAAIANIEVTLKEKLVENAFVVGEYLMKRLKELQDENELIGDVRGKGLLIGVELVKNDRKKPATDEARKLSMNAREKGLRVVVVGTYHQVLRLTPPLIVTKEQADEALSILEQTLKELNI